MFIYLVVSSLLREKRLAFDLEKFIESFRQLPISFIKKKKKKENLESSFNRTIL